MTYCAAAVLDSGIILVSDSRTHAGVDNVSTYSKMHTFGNPGGSQFVVLSAGNLATTQSVIGQIKKDISQGADANLFTMQHMVEAADYIGDVSIEQQHRHEGSKFEASFIVAGQILEHKPHAYLVYPEGNHITTSTDTPYLQIGELKYGKPILDRIVQPEVSLETAALCCLVSMDSTMRSNLSVGPPIELLVYERDSQTTDRRYRFDETSAFLRELTLSWDSALKRAFASLPPISWSGRWDAPGVDAPRVDAPRVDASGDAEQGPI